ncbi:MAG TPA: TIGR00269 family protein [Methanotrichaceae archaeon]|nr:TIGR00269 family protein [Methanotrichaceae archaeon]
MKCSRCDDSAIISQRYSGTHLCQRHFTESFEQKVEEAMHKGHMIEKGDLIAVALSGGKDSTALLHILNKILSQDDVELVAITIDEGIKGYREDTIRSARKITADLGIRHVVVSFKDKLGLDLDEIVVGRKEAPCTFCGVFRKTLLNRTAKELGATKVATGHDLDDEAQSIAMNYLKADIERLARFAPRRVQKGLVPRIKPIKDIPEREVALYCMVQGFYVKMAECPYASLSFRSDVRDMLNGLEKRFPGTKHSLLRGFEAISDPLAGRYPQIDLKECRVCGEPCIKDLCKACELLERLKPALDGTKS